MMEDIYSRHEESTFMAMVVLLHKESLCQADGTCVLDSLDENSHKHSAGVSDALKYALRECIEILGNEVIYDMKTKPIHTYMMRCKDSWNFRKDIRMHNYPFLI
jgi:hypothetical protein